jgi:hypothetical protein
MFSSNRSDLECLYDHIPIVERIKPGELDDLGDLLLRWLGGSHVY